MTGMQYTLLEKVNSPADLKRLSADELRLCCDELRRYIIEQCSVNPGHLASSLGTVELTAALHYVFDTPDDKIVWDVGHQTYAHKILTGGWAASAASRAWPRVRTTHSEAATPRCRSPRRSAWPRLPNCGAKSGRW